MSGTGGAADGGERAVRLLVSGRVQGVGFRYYAQDEARELGLRGWVRNLADGRVEAQAAGPAEAIARFAAALRRGPRGALVTDLVIEDLAAAPERAGGGFHIER